MSSIDDLAAMQDIRDVLSLYCERLDSFDIDGVVALFTDDCVLSSRLEPGVSEHRGREALRNLLLNDEKGSKGSRYTHHQLGQIRIEVDGAQAMSVAYCTADHDRWDGRRMTVRFQYQDRLVYRPEGWRISQRRILATVCDGEPEVRRAHIHRMHSRNLAGD